MFNPSGINITVLSLFSLVFHKLAGYDEMKER